MEARGRTALITGGAVRVGRAISHALAKAGARVIVHYNSSADAVEELVREIRDGGGDATALRADLRSMAATLELAERAEGAGPIDILINNASVFPAATLGEVTAEIWDETMGVNLRAPFFLTQRLGEGMKGRGAGVIVNLADLAALQTWTGYAAHSVSKAGLVHLTRIAARALAPEVRVAAIAPGTVLPPEDLSREEVERLAARTPLKRIGSPADVAAAVMYLIGADFVTGEVMVVDGGRASAR